MEQRQFLSLHSRLILVSIHYMLLAGEFLSCWVILLHSQVSCMEDPVRGQQEAVRGWEITNLTQLTHILSQYCIRTRGWTRLPPKQQLPVSTTQRLKPQKQAYEIPKEAMHLKTEPESNLLLLVSIQSALPMLSLLKKSTEKGYGDRQS